MNIENTRFAATSEFYVGTGVRVYPSSTGATDPFAELGLGGDFGGGPTDVAFATELTFGVSVALTEQVKISSELTAHQRGASCQVCRGESGWAKRWITLGLGLELWLGDKH